MNALKLKNQVVRMAAKAGLAGFVLASHIGKQTPAKIAIRALWKASQK